MPSSDDQLHELIHACYEAALDSARWPALLDRLRAKVGAERCGCLASQAGRGELGQAVARTAANSVGPCALSGDGPDAAERLLHGLLPHLDRCRQIRLRLTTAEDRVAGLSAALDRLPLAVFLLDAGGRAVHVNTGADALIRAGDGLTLCEGRVTAATRPEADRLQRLITSAAGRGACRSGMIALSRPSGGQPHLMVVAPLATVPDGSGASVLLLVRGTDAAPDVSGACLIDLYGLTGAEARVATALLAADTLPEIAARLGIGLATVRSHLHRLFDKTGTRRQAELVGLLATLALL
jgi:DNA-binding CsgD family transcriptional regulator